MLRFLPLLWLLLGAPAFAADAAASAERIVSVAREALLARAQAEGIDVLVEPVGRVQSVSAAASEVAEVAVIDWQSPWLRSRVGVPVQVRAASGISSTVVVWFALSAPKEGLVYAQDAARGASGAQTPTTMARYDLARSGEPALSSPEAIVVQRLRRSVRAGMPVLASDFEAIPTVQAQQPVRIAVAQGAVRLDVAGRALVDGETGQIISVLPSHATEPVRARVVSSQVVTLEN
ncbi:flagellar basal body P-ring formation chaperone FlgA [Arenimonas sp.]|uniref:flagellar basal body P-ring formation chaperone FlgA n=1 Tax=Arenimonas sp. TaxID=1872635 RepID=UPI0039E38033